MQEHRYPCVERHMKLHEEFLVDYDELTDELEDLGPSQELADQTAKTIQDWLVYHILEADMDYVKHVRTQVYRKTGT